MRAVCNLNGPCGLPWENPALPSEGQEGLHDYLYQDKEFQFRDFADGNKGLMLYDFHARMYDPTTATWSVPDPAAQFANPYLAMGNNPVLMIDPDGQWIHIAIGAVIGAVVNTVSHWDDITANGFDLVEFGKAAGIGAVAGGLTAATGGAMTAAVGGVGAGGFATGFVISAASTTAGNIVLSEGNHYAFGDPRWTPEQYALAAGIGGVIGGTVNGYLSYKQGNSFWTGNAKKVVTNHTSYGYNSSGKKASIEVGKPSNNGFNSGAVYDSKGYPVNQAAKAEYNKMLNDFPKLEKHFVKHYEKFIVPTADGSIEPTLGAYYNRAIALRDAIPSDNILTHTSQQGWIFKYNVSTNDFITVHPRGYIETLFKPENGVNYFMNQIPKYP